MRSECPGPAQWMSVSPPCVWTSFHVSSLIGLHHQPLSGGRASARGTYFPGYSSCSWRKGWEEIQRPKPTLLPVPNLSLQQHLMRNPNTCHCRPASRPQLPGIRKARPSLSLVLYSQHLKSAAELWRCPELWESKAQHVCARGTCYASGKLIKRGGKGGGRRGGKQLCLGSEWVTARLRALGWPPAGEVRKLWGEYQVSPCRGLFQLKAASSPLNPIKGQYYVSGNVCQS